MDITNVSKGKYEVVRPLGTGGDGTVYLVKNTALDNLWAVKCIDRTQKTRLHAMDEANLLGKLYHPMLPKVFDVYRTEHNDYIVMEYIEGMNLEDWMKKEEKPSVKQIIDWACDVCGVMMYLHNHKDGAIIYRDLKPKNLIITPQNHIRLVDFGIARAYKEDVSNDTVRLGTQGFAAPEQYGTGQSDKRTDIYGFGMTFITLLSGCLPSDQRFEAFNRTKKTHAMQALCNIFNKCRATEPSHRYDCFEQVLQALKERSKSSMKRQKKTQNQKSIKYERKIIAVWGNAAFACEFAYITARICTSNVLIVDFDLLNPQIDIHFGLMPKHGAEAKKRAPGGVDRLMEALYRENFSNTNMKMVSLPHPELDNLRMITGSENIRQYEYYSVECLDRFLNQCLRYDDMVILVINPFIYDAYTLHCLMAADIVLYAGQTDLASLRAIHSQMNYLCQKQQMDAQRFYLISWCEPPEAMLPMDVLADLTNQRFVGRISSRKKRDSLINQKSFYGKKADRKTMREYIHILKKIKVVDRRVRLKSYKEYLQ